MTKVEDKTVLRSDELLDVRCPTCGDKVELGKDGEGYTALHCDRSIKVEPESYIVSVSKITPENINIALESNTKSIDKSKKDDKEIVEEIEEGTINKLSDEDEIAIDELE